MSVEQSRGAELPVGGYLAEGSQAGRCDSRARGVSEEDRKAWHR